MKCRRLVTLTPGRLAMSAKSGPGFTECSLSGATTWQAAQLCSAIFSPLASSGVEGAPASAYCARAAHTLATPTSQRAERNRNMPVADSFILSFATRQYTHSYVLRPDRKRRRHEPGRPERSRAAGCPRHRFPSPVVALSDGPATADDQLSRPCGSLLDDASVSLGTQHIDQAAVDRDSRGAHGGQ